MDLDTQLITEILKLSFYRKEKEQSNLRQKWHCVVTSYDNLKGLIGMVKSHVTSFLNTHCQNKPTYELPEQTSQGL